MRKIRGIEFIGQTIGYYADEANKSSLRQMKENCSCNTAVFVISAMQETAHATTINYQHEYMPKDLEIKEMVEYAQELGMQTILKPNLLCMDGTSRAQINADSFSGKRELEWKQWFCSYTEYLIHYARLAQKMRCDMMFLGSGLVNAEVFEGEWRSMIQKVREVYRGFLTYCTEPETKDHVSWWDAIDFIATTGYMENSELEQYIEQQVPVLVKTHDKPFLLGEFGCKSCRGSASEPGNWMLQGQVDVEEQSRYFKEYLMNCNRSDYISGLVVSNWCKSAKRLEDERQDAGYSIAGKPASSVIQNIWTEQEETILPKSVHQLS